MYKSKETPSTQDKSLEDFTKKISNYLLIHKALKLGFVGLLSTTILILIFFTIFNSKINIETTKLKTSEKAVGQQIPNTLNWKTYSSNSYSFKYPSSWEAPKKYLQSTKTEVDFGQKFSIISGFYYNQELNREITFREYLQEFAPNPSKIYTLDGVQGKRFSFKDSVGNIEDIVTVADSGNSTNITTLTFTYAPDDSKSLQVFNQILSTFKFMPTAPSATPTPTLTLSEKLQNKRAVYVTKSDGTRVTIDLDNANKYPQSRVADDLNGSYIRKTVKSPDETKIVVVTQNQGASFFVVLLTTFSRPSSLEEIGLDDELPTNSILWSGDSRYVTTVARPTNIGPYVLSVWDTQKDRRATVNKLSNLLNDSCASLSTYNPKWIDNTHIQVDYEAYYFTSDKNCPYDPNKPVQKGVAIVSVE